MTLSPVVYTPALVVEVKSASRLIVLWLSTLP